MLLYSICFYYGKNNTSNIKNHLESFSKIRNHNDLFILTVMIDSKEQPIHEETKQILSTFIKSHSDLPFVILTGFNWGGTIVGLWMTYQYGKENHKEAYITHFEEDFVPNNNNWYSKSKKLLKDDIIYVGECVGNGNYNINKKYLECDDWINYKKRVKINSANESYNHAVWTEGGFYFSKINRLMLVEKKIGIFHKGNQNTKYHHDLDGIDLGEVGFPTLLFHNDFKFTSLKRETYFNHIT